MGQTHCVFSTELNASRLNFIVGIAATTTGSRPLIRFSGCQEDIQKSYCNSETSGMQWTQKYDNRENLKAHFICRNSPSCWITDMNFTNLLLIFLFFNQYKFQTQWSVSSSTM